MKAPLLIGKLVMLRAIEDRDRALMAESKRDPEFLRLVGEEETVEPPLTDDQFESVKQSQFHWAIEVNDSCIGIALIHSLNEKDKQAVYAIAIFESENWGRGYGEESTRLVLDHAFNTLSLHRVWLRVLAYNHRAIRCYEKCGFIIEGTQRESALLNGVWYDDILMGILASEFRR